MAEGQNWRIKISSPFVGLAPGWWENSYPSFGNRSHSGRMTNCDILDPSKITQGKLFVNLTAGTQAGAVTTLIKRVLDFPSSSGVGWAIGGAKLYKFSNTAVTNAGAYPHTIDKGAVTAEDGEDMVVNGDYLYYFYNHSGSAGDIGRLTISTDTFDDDFGSTIPATGAAALVNAPHAAIKGLDGIIYFTNGRYVGTYDETNDVLDTQALDLYADAVAVDLVWEKNILWIAYNRPNISGSNNNEGVIIAWDTVSSTFQEPIIEVGGKVGALVLKNGLVYCFYQDVASSQGKLGRIRGDMIEELRSFNGSLPSPGQAIKYKNMIAWLSDALLYLWGAVDVENPITLSNHATLLNATGGGLAVPFGNIIAGSTAGANYSLAKLGSSYATDCQNKTKMFDVFTSTIDKVTVIFEPTAANARVDVKLEYNQVSSKTLGTITHTNQAGKTRVVFEPKLANVEDFRIFLDWANANATNPLSVRSIIVEGHYVFKK